MNWFKKLEKYCDQHFWRCVALLIFLLLLLIGNGIVLMKIGQRQMYKWDGWLWAHQAEIVPGIQYNVDNCVGSSSNKYANTFCEEPPELYKKYWVKKTYTGLK